SFAARSIRYLLTVGFLVVGGTSARGQFARVYNAPPTNFLPTSVGSNTQVNVFVGGSLPAAFEAGATNGTSTNVEVNIYGGNVGGNLNAYGGSTINISGGSFGLLFQAHAGSTVNISGGSVGNVFLAESGSTVNISGGSVGTDFEAQSGSTI